MLIDYFGGVWNFFRIFEVDQYSIGWVDYPFLVVVVILVECYTCLPFVCIV